MSKLARLDVERARPQLAAGSTTRFRPASGSGKIVRSHSWAERAFCLLPVIVATVLPVLLTPHLWSEVWSGVQSQAWDGSGHQALAQSYSEQTFPDVFGWTNAFYGGMPHPNLYPPLLYWLTALLDRIPLVSFMAAFKTVIALPTLLLPAATYLLAWRISRGNRLLAFCAALSVTAPLVDLGFFIASGPLGVTYMSTFLTGLYSHPLGHVLLILWYAAYCDDRQPMWRICLTAVLLALALLASFFSASITALFILFTLLRDVLRLRHAVDREAQGEVRRTLVAHTVSPVIAGVLVLFWLAPVFAARDYMMTRPSYLPLRDLISSATIIWYSLAVIGIVLGLRRRRADMLLPYLATCVTLTGAIIFSGTLAPRWFPFHPTRLIATLNFLLAVPVGITLASVLRVLTRSFRSTTVDRHVSTKLAGRGVSARTAAPARPLYMLGAALLLIVGTLVILGAITPTRFDLSFYQVADRGTIDPVLAFAREHRDGRYLVEVAPFASTEAAHEARALNNYLGGQGNEVLSLFFREASPNVLFFSPLVNVFSSQSDTYGISSVLADDLAFANQSVTEHLRQLQHVGVRYLVIRSTQMRNHLTADPSIAVKHDFGQWSVYELGQGVVSSARPLAYKPALIVTDLNIKGRRNNAYDFVRLAEEQLVSNWYDVLLARSSESHLDRLKVDQSFGAVVVESYEYGDEDQAFTRLQEIARRHPVILLESDNPLFRRLRDTREMFPSFAIIRREQEAPGDWIEPGPPTRSYAGTTVRRVWGELQRALDERKEAVTPAVVTGQSDGGRIDIRPEASLQQATPVLVNTTFHPNWRRTDGEQIYPVTPFWMLTFVREPTHLTFARRPSDWAGLTASVLTFLLLCVAMAWRYGGTAARRSSRTSRLSLGGERRTPEVASSIT